MKMFFTLLFVCFSLISAKAEAAEYDVISLETIEAFCKEHKVEFTDWQTRYLDQVKKGTGVIYPRVGSIHNKSSDQQRWANMISFYCEVRAKRGDALISLNHQYLVFSQGQGSPK